MQHSKFTFGTFSAICAPLLSFIVVLASAPAHAQDDLFDAMGNLERMPFELDIPVDRTSTETTERGQLFHNYTSMSYDDCVEHYQAKYAAGRELAPGWRIVGYGFDVGADVFAFSIVYAEQRYRLAVHPNADNTGSIVTFVARGVGRGHLPFVPSVMPLRPFDVDPIPYEIRDL